MILINVIRPCRHSKSSSSAWTGRLTGACLRFHVARARCGHGLQAAVGTSAHPNDQDQTDDDPDDVGDHVEERVKAKRDFARTATTSDHGTARDYRRAVPGLVSS